MSIIEIDRVELLGVLGQFAREEGGVQWGSTHVIKEYLEPSIIRFYLSFVTFVSLIQRGAELSDRAIPFSDTDFKLFGKMYEFARNKQGENVTGEAAKAYLIGLLGETSRNIPWDRVAQK